MLIEEESGTVCEDGDVRDGFVVDKLVGLRGLDDIVHHEHTT